MPATWRFTWVAAILLVSPFHARIVESFHPTFYRTSTIVAHPQYLDAAISSLRLSSFEDVVPEEARRDMEEKDGALKQAEANAAAALKAVERAQEALQSAQSLVSSAQREVSERSKAVVFAETAQKRAEDEADRLERTVAQRRELVREALAMTEEAMRTEGESREESLQRNFGEQPDPAEVEELVREEEFLATESERLEQRAERLRSKARKLMIRAQSFPR